MTRLVKTAKLMMKSLGHDLTDGRTFGKNEWCATCRGCGRTISVFKSGIIFRTDLKCDKRSLGNVGIRAAIDRALAA